MVVPPRLAALALACLSGTAVAAETPNALKPLLQCRSVADSAARLACYDGQADQLKRATDSSDIMVVDKADVQKARRSVFGLSLPSLSFLDRDEKGKAVELTQIDGKIAGVSPAANGKWRFVLDDGSRWIQIEPHDFVRDPKSGMSIKIRKAAVGSYLANLDGQIAVRVERER